MQNTRRPSRQPMTNFTQSNPCADYSDKVQVKVCTPTTRHVWNWRWTLQTINAETLRSNAFITSQPVAYEPGGVGAAVSPGLKNSGQTLFIRASSSCSKILKDKNYFNTVKNFRANSVFQGKSRLFKILNDKNIYSLQWIQGTPCFSGQAQVAQKSLI